MPAIALALFIVTLGIVPNWAIRWSEPQVAVLLSATEDNISYIPPTNSLLENSIAKPYH
jgi:NADH:ubiquinone oxidoreductase subunit 4 (subunit M)